MTRLLEGQRSDLHPRMTVNHPVPTGDVPAAQLSVRLYLVSWQKCCQGFQEDTVMLSWANMALPTPFVPSVSNRKRVLYAHVPPSLVSISACCPLQISPPCFPLKLLRANQALSLTQTLPESRPCCKWRLGEGPSRSTVGCSVLLTENRTCCSFPAICQPLLESHLRPAPSSCCLSLSEHKGSLRVMTTEKIML